MHNFDVNSANSADGYDNSDTVAVADADAAAVANASVFWAVTPTNSVMSAQAYKKCIKQLRKKHLISSCELANKVFLDHQFDCKVASWFYENPSEFLETMCVECHEEYTRLEDQFTHEMLSLLIDPAEYEDMAPAKAIRLFAKKFPQHLKALCTLNGQIKRS